MLNNNSIIIEYSACKLYEITRHNRCYNCLYPGHLAKDCSNTAVCTHCAGPHHARDCVNDAVKCIFCIRNSLADVNHPSYSCPLMQH